MLSVVLSKLSADADTEVRKINGLTTFLNPYSYMILRNSSFDLSRFDSICVDSFYFAKLFNIIFGTKIDRLSFDFTSLASPVLQHIIENDRSVWFVGSTEEVIQEFTTKIRKRYPQLHVIGFGHGHFSSDEQRESAVKHIASRAPEYLICGMGAGNQEKFLAELRQSGWNGRAFTCGGFFHQEASTYKNYYPKFFDKTNTRWLYRIMDEPKLMFRYGFAYPIAICLFLIDCVSLKFAQDEP